MSSPTLVLDLFPGIGLLARAFETEGFCVVSGPDLIFGGDVRVFHPPPGVFAGVIGGPLPHPPRRNHVVAPTLDPDIGWHEQGERT